MEKKQTNNGRKGGWLVGKRHYDKNGKPLGGIKAVVTDAGGKPVELEGGEVIINREASKKHWKELSRINQSAGNGVAIAPPSGALEEDPEDNYEHGGKIDFNPNHIPSKMIVNYAKNIKSKHPEIWKLGGNIFGNEAFENLLRVSNRGYWLDSEEWMYIKWRAYVARHAKDFRIEGVVAMLKWCDKVDKGWAYMKQLIEEKIEKIDAKKGWKHKTSKMKDGGRTISQTPAPLKDRISGSKFNEKGSASTSSKASDIKFDDNTIKSIQRLIDEHNEEHPSKKITLSVAKAVVRRGMGAYSSSHRPTISGGKANSRTAWGLARLKAFIYKAQTGKSKSGNYSQDNDLFEELGISVQKMAQGGLIAPNGKPSNLTPEQYKLVRTPAFKKWFGDWENDPENASKVVDENGEPLVVYRGSKSKNPNYIPHKHELSNGIYFSTKKEVAELYTTSVWQNWVGRVFECFLNIRNLDEYDTLQLKSNIYQADFDYYNKIVTTSYENKFDGIRWDNFIDVPDLQNIFPKEPIDFIATTFIVFEPTQIKLADGTNTTFDGNNPDIRYKDGGEVEKGASKSYNILMQHLDEYCQYHFNEHLDEDSFMIKTIKNGNGHKVQELLGTTKSGRDVHISIDQLYMKDGGEVDFGKVSSASSRFRPSETIVFDPPLVGMNGNKLVSYTWKYEWTTDFSIKTGDAIEKRVSDWSQAETSADTGRNIVHSFTIVKPDGSSQSVSSESVPVVMGFVTKEQKKDFSNLATASKTLAKQQMQLSILEAKQKEYDEVQQSIIDAGYPEIQIKPWLSDDKVKLTMGDGSVIADANNPNEKERIEQLKDSYVRVEMQKLGINPYRGNFNYQIYELKKRIERQKRKVENIIDSNKMADGGSVDAKDTVTLDIPLLIRTLELAREDIKSDAELHEMVERLLDLKNKPELTMDDYAYIADIEHKHLKPKMEVGGNIEIEKLIAKAHDNLTRKRGRKEYAPTSHELQEEIDRMIMEDQFGSNNI